MIEAISLIADMVSTYADTAIEVITMASDTVKVDTSQVVLPSQSIESTQSSNLALTLLFFFKYLLAPSVLVPLSLWFFNGRPKIFIKGTGRIEHKEGVYGEASGDFQLAFTLINNGKRAARITGLQVEGYNDPGPTVPIRLEEQEPISGGRCFLSEESKFQNPLAPGEELNVTISLDIIGYSANYVIINLRYKDDEIKLCWMRRLYYYTVHDHQLQEMVESEKPRLDLMIKREKKLYRARPNSQAE
ncbi:MAG: hypothetical protein FVQ79_12585 [Planctomycetes bacterium]|nr:hypothetical protein [Planctomycetota bacterium]